MRSSSAFLDFLQLGFWGMIVSRGLRGAVVSGREERGAEEVCPRRLAASGKQQKSNRAR